MVRITMTALDLFKTGVVAGFVDASNGIIEPITPAPQTILYKEGWSVGQKAYHELMAAILIMGEEEDWKGNFFGSSSRTD